MSDYLTPVENHPTYVEKTPATSAGKTGLIHSVWKDAAGDLHVVLFGPGFDEEETIPVADVTLGGTPDLFKPTLAAIDIDARTYDLIDLKQPDGCVPPGWAVFHKHDSVYVAWGLSDREQARLFAIGHSCGISFFGSKM